MSYVLNNALQVLNLTFVVDYPNALVSRGGLIWCAKPNADLATAGEVTFWLG